jgi:hypothetical protein
LPLIIFKCATEAEQLWNDDGQQRYRMRERNRLSEKVIAINKLLAAEEDE